MQREVRWNKTVEGRLLPYVCKECHLTHLELGETSETVSHLRVLSNSSQLLVVAGNIEYWIILQDVYMVLLYILLFDDREYELLTNKLPFRLTGSPILHLTRRRGWPFQSTLTCTISASDQNIWHTCRRYSGKWPSASWSSTWRKEFVGHCASGWTHHCFISMGGRPPHDGHVSALQSGVVCCQCVLIMLDSTLQIAASSHRRRHPRFHKNPKQKQHRPIEFFFQEAKRWHQIQVLKVNSNWQRV